MELAMRITFVLKNGATKFGDFSEGETLLQVAERAGIRLDSRCEGNGVCGGCHVVIKNQSCLQPISAHEESGLDNVNTLSLKSRLACQIVLTQQCDELEVEIV